LLFDVNTEKVSGASVKTENDDDVRNAFDDGGANLGVAAAAATAKTLATDPGGFETEQKFPATVTASKILGKGTDSFFLLRLFLGHHLSRY
jgi:hypothetical protein